MVLQNLIHIGKGVPQFSSDIQTNKQRLLLYIHIQNKLFPDEMEFLRKLLSLYPLYLSLFYLITLKNHNRQTNNKYAFLKQV